MFRSHLVRYIARTATGTEQGIAAVKSEHGRPSQRECADQIDGYITGEYLGLEPQYTLRYSTPDGVKSRTLPSTGVERVGQVVMRLADREQVWNIEVLDEAGDDVTFDFACFR